MDKVYQELDLRRVMQLEMDEGEEEQKKGEDDRIRATERLSNSPISIKMNIVLDEKL